MKPTSYPTESYSFRTVNLSMVDADLIRSELKAERPLLFIKRGDGKVAAMIHPSILVKASMMDPKYEEELNVYINALEEEWVPKKKIMGLWSLIKNIKDGPVLPEYEDEQVVTVTLPEV